MMTALCLPLAFISPGPMEMLIIGVVAVLLFGKRLPEVGRSLGKGIVEFKRGISGIQDEIDTAAHRPSSSSSSSTYNDIDDRDEATAPRFDPPAAEPKNESETV